MITINSINYIMMSPNKAKDAKKKFSIKHLASNTSVWV